MKSIGYDIATHTLRVQFVSGGSYDYSHVSADVHAALLQAPSKGTFIAKLIKGKSGKRV